MITQKEIDVTYKHLNLFQMMFQHIVEEEILERLPQGIRASIRDVEYDAGYEGLIYVNFKKHPGKSIDYIVCMFRSLFDKNMDVEVYPEGMHPEEFSIRIDLHIPKNSRKWYID